MKKINKILSIASVLTVLSLSFTACFNPAFYQINQDVVSESSLVDGSINSIARYTVGGEEYLVLAGGQNLTSKKGLLYKEISKEGHGGWSVFPQENLPFTLHSYDYYGEQDHTGEQIIKVLANSTHLYLVTATYKNNNTLGTNSPEVIKIWAAKIENWENVEKTDWTNIIEGEEAEKCPLYDSSDNTYSAFSVFSTNAPRKENRSVYLRSGNGSTVYPNKYYKIEGTTLSDVTNLTYLKTGSDGLEKTETSNMDDVKTINFKSVVNVNGTEIFLTSVAATTDETYSSPATKYYTSYGTSIIYGTDTENPVTTVNVGGAIASLAYCSDVLLIGRGEFVSSNATSDGGIDKVALDNGVPGTSLGNFTTNAKSQLLSSYIVQQLLNATPENSELDSILYASTTFIGTASSTQATFKNVGLWSYYPEPVRGNWNKE